MNLVDYLTLVVIFIYIYIIFIDYLNRRKKMNKRKKTNIILDQKIAFRPFYADYRVIKYLFKEEALLAKTNNTIDNKKNTHLNNRSDNSSNIIYIESTVFLF